MEEYFDISQLFKLQECVGDLYFNHYICTLWTHYDTKPKKLLFL
jgi:hypothetical protein